MWIEVLNELGSKRLVNLDNVKEITNPSQVGVDTAFKFIDGDVLFSKESYECMAAYFNLRISKNEFTDAKSTQELLKH